jgi:hypothetical protein
MSSSLLENLQIEGNLDASQLIASLILEHASALQTNQPKRYTMSPTLARV